MSQHKPTRVRARFFTPGTNLLLGLMGIGYAFGITRFIIGLESVTNLTDFHPWGIWIAIDVACGVALAAGGFTTAFLVDIFGGKRFKPLLRPAILTAWLGYAFVGFALLFDLGRYWNIWRPMFHWQGNSVLFEVGLCVMAYLFVLTVEMATPLLQGIQDRIDAGDRGANFLRRFQRPLQALLRVVKVVLPLFVIAGVVLSCMHQSSLGTLMVIAPTKLSSIWYTPWMPVLFLMSAIAVGLPMVIVESLSASRSLRRKPEMDLLGPAGAISFWLLLAYAIVRCAVLVANLGEIDWLADDTALVSFIVELTIGILLPLVLLAMRWVRRSPGWLYFAALLVVLGVVINRINVFIVGYHPPFTTESYAPSLGEISVTVGIICTIIFVYRIFIFFFPIITGPVEEKPRPRRTGPEHSTPIVAWSMRVLAGLALLMFVVLYAAVHTEAVSGQLKAAGWAGDFAPTGAEKPALTRSEHSARPEGYLKVFQLESPILNKRTDYYEPVRFAHLSHDVATGGDCSACHHRWSDDESDRVGQDLREMHVEYEVRLSGPCTSCHDLEDFQLQKCSACHWNAGEPDDSRRLGLKGAYHHQCMGCHERNGGGERFPTDCAGCHHPRTPDHSKLVEPVAEKTRNAFTARCLSCHEQTGRDVVRSAHWSWDGHSEALVGHEDGTGKGVMAIVNNHCFTSGTDRDHCAQCHIGLSAESLTARNDRADPRDVDCFVCHDTTGTYARAKEGGQPVADVDLAAVAQAVGRPSRATCGRCHFNSGGGPNWKHGDLEPILAGRPGDQDVHMGQQDMRCQECHRGERHRVAGASMTAPGLEGRVACERCHGDAPHGISGPAGVHLDAHSRSVACQTCHIPTIARTAETRVSIDMETVKKPEECAKGGETPGASTLCADQKFAKDLVPTYRWYDGTREALFIGEKIDPDDTVELNAPLGDLRAPRARIYPFKVHEARQPYDKKTNQLLVPRLADGLFAHGDWKQALAEGMKDLGGEFSGEHGFVETRMFTGVHHMVLPAKKALACTDCHKREAVACGRCHSGADDDSTPAHLMPERTELRLDYEALGYEGDPAEIGGRFTTAPGPGRPIK